MENITQDEFDQLVSHTIRIELKDGSILHFMVSPEAKRACRDHILKESFSIFGKDYLWFYIPEDRLVLINEKDIIRITFCFDTPSLGEAEYSDNFNVLEKFPPEIDPELEDEEYEMEDAGPAIDLPGLIIKHRRQKEDSEIVDGVTMKTEGFYGNISYYFDLSEGDIHGLEVDYFEEEEGWVLMTSKYFRFLDEDGEENFMLLKNLSVIEIERSFIMSDKNLALYLAGK